MGGLFASGNSLGSLSFDGFLPETFRLLCWAG